MNNTKLGTAVAWLESKYQDLIKEAKEIEELKMMHFANWCRIYENKNPNEINTIQQLYSKYVKENQS